MAIPVLSIPCINRPDLLERCLASIDVPVGALYIIDNSPDGLDFAVPAHLEAFTHVETPPRNLGVAASWNLAIKAHPAAPWWCIANADTEFGPGDLARLAAEMAQGGARWVGVNGDWRVFGVSLEAIETAGYWDESFVPCYIEDCDYEYRCTLTGVPWYFIEGTSTHAGSASIASDERYRRANAKSYPANVAYYHEKWGGPQRGGEVYLTPFNRGGHPREWAHPSPRRLRDLAW